MKRNLFVLLFVCMFVVSAQSQVRLGLRAGVNSSGASVSGSGGVNHLFDKNVSGLEFGALLECMIHDKFGIETGLLYTERGMKSTGDAKTKNGYIDLPLNLRFKFPVSETVKPFLNAGPYVSMRISGDGNFDQVWNEIDQQWKARAFGAGLNFGGGVELFRFLQLGVNYGLSMTDNYKESDGNYTVKDRTWSATATVYF